MIAICHDQLYQKRLKRAFDKKVFPRSLKAGDLVLRKTLPIQTDLRGKWTPNYEGSYIVRKVFYERALILTIMDDKDLPSHVNTDVVKKYYA